MISTPTFSGTSTPKRARTSKPKKLQLAKLIPVSADGEHVAMDAVDPTPPDAMPECGRRKTGIKELGAGDHTVLALREGEDPAEALEDRIPDDRADARDSEHQAVLPVAAAW